jgi:hypothetical protein
MIALVAASLCAAALTGQTPKQSDDSKATVTKVFEAWKQLRGKFKSVRYRASGTETIPRGSIVLGPEVGGSGMPEPKEDVTLPHEVVLLIDFLGNRHRIETNEHVYSAAGRVDTRQTVSAHDGKELWWSWPSGGSTDRGPTQPDASILAGNLTEAGFTCERWPYFIAHGIVPKIDTHIVPGRLAPKLNEKDFYHHATAQFEDRGCVVLRTHLSRFTSKSFNEYWVDMDRGGLVLRQVVYVSNEPAIILDLQYRDGPAGWMLGGWTVTVRHGGSTERIHQMTVDSCQPEVDITDEDFKLVLTSGMKVTRLHRGGNEDRIGRPVTISDQEFVVDANGRLVQTGGTPTPRGYFWWILGACSAAFLLLCMFWLRRRRAAE